MLVALEISRQEANDRARRAHVRLSERGEEVTVEALVREALQDGAARAKRRARSASPGEGKPDQDRGPDGGDEVRFLRRAFGLLAWPFWRWRAWRAERVCEWLVSLDGQDLAVLSDAVHEDMFWSWHRVQPLHASFLPRLLDEEAWDRNRFSVRHRHSGRRVSTFAGGGAPPQPWQGSYRILLRWFTPLDEGPRPR